MKDIIVPTDSMREDTTLDRTNCVKYSIAEAIVEGEIEIFI